MVETRRSIGNEVENRATFYERLHKNIESEASIEKIKTAYDFSKGALRFTEPRESGERQFEHARGTAVIVMDEMGIYDPDLIIASLFHDIVEDTTIWGPHNKVSNFEMRDTAYARISEQFNSRVAEMVLAVTKPIEDGINISSREEKIQTYLDQLKSASPEAIILKMADRLNNLRDLQFRSFEDQQKVARETLVDYLPIFESGRAGHEAETDGIIDEIRELANQYLSDEQKAKMVG